MLIGDKITIRQVYGIDSNDMDAIQKDLGNRINEWCSKHTVGDCFVARDLVGRERWNWSETPLQVLYDQQIDKGKSEDDAYKQAAKNVGNILKKVLFDTPKSIIFERKEGYTATYLWKK